MQPTKIMVIAGIPHEELRHTRAAQEWLAEVRQEEAVSVTLRLLNRRCGPLSEATTAQIRALPVDKMEALAVGAAFSAGVALLDFQGPADLAAWLAGVIQILAVQNRGGEMVMAVGFPLSRQAVQPE